MSPVHPYARMWGLGVGLILGFGGLAGWLGYWQVQQHERYAGLARANQQRKAAIPARRGSILDAGRNLLALTRPVKTVSADLALVGTNRVLLARTLAPLLQLREADLLRRLTPRTNAKGKALTNACVLLKEKVPLQQWLQITQAMSRVAVPLPKTGPRGRLRAARLALKALRERAILGEDDYQREYPGGKLAAHVLGYSASGEAEGDHGRVRKTYGVDGLELTYDQALSGVDGWRSRYEEVAPTPGLNLVLTLDAGVQNIVERVMAVAMRELQPGAISVIVMRPGTGQVLALANCPAFDPNRYQDYPVTNLCNHAISVAFEPGSTFKIVVVSAALDMHRVTLHTTFDCEHSSFKYADYVLHDAHPHGLLTVEQILAKSSNIGAAKLGLALGAQCFYVYITNYGFGAFTGVPLGGESRGNVHPLERWKKVSITRVPMGHEVLATPLQMTFATAVPASRGRLMRPMLVDHLEDDQGHVVRQLKPEVVRQVLSPETARQMVQAMKSVCSKEGTGGRARLERYTVAGKTGTADKALNGHYNTGRYLASFIGFFPASDPALCIGVFVDDPDRRKGHFGGEVAAPIWRTIAEQTAGYLRIPPDLEPEAPPAAHGWPRPVADSTPLARNSKDRHGAAAPSVVAQAKPATP